MTIKKKTEIVAVPATLKLEDFEQKPLQLNIWEENVLNAVG